jgi:hypothetical protein
MVAPPVREALTVHPLRGVPQADVTGPEPQLLATHRAEIVPLVVTKQMLPDGQATVPGAEAQRTTPQAAVWTAQLPPEQVAWVRPALGQLS